MWSNAIKAGCMPLAVFTLVKGPLVSTSAVEDTKLLIVFHPVRIGMFLLGLGLTGFGDGQSMR